MTAILGVLIFPWIIINHLFLFYSFIGSMFGPIAGIMISDFFINKKGTLNLREIYAPEKADVNRDYNPLAVIVLIISFSLSMVGAFFPEVAFLKNLNNFAFFSGLISSFVLYTILILTKRQKG